MTEDEMIGRHHQLNGYEFEQSPRDSEGQRSLACYSPQGRKELNMTWRLSNDNKYGREAEMGSLPKGRARVGLPLGKNKRLGRAAATVDKVSVFS